MLDDLITFTLVLMIKLVTEIGFRWSDNCYYTGHGMKAALSATLICAVGIPISREVIAEGNNSAAVATVLAVFVGTIIGQRDFEQRKQ